MNEYSGERSIAQKCVEMESNQAPAVGQFARRQANGQNDSVYPTEITMPMGPLPGGLAYFVATKFLGYSAFAHHLRRRFEDRPGKGWARTVAVGGLRTGIGVIAGISYGLLASKTELFGDGQYAGTMFLAMLLPIRVLEWLLLMQIAFELKRRAKGEIAWDVSKGIMVSYALDGIGIVAAFALPGGMWVC